MVHVECMSLHTQECLDECLEKVLESVLWGLFGGLVKTCSDPRDAKFTATFFYRFVPLSSRRVISDRRKTRTCFFSPAPRWPSFSPSLFFLAARARASCH